MNAFILQWCIKLIKSDRKDSYITKYFYFLNIIIINNIILNSSIAVKNENS